MFIRVLILLPLTVVIVLLAVANRVPVQVSLDPFSGTAPLIAVTAPLFVIVLGAIAVGVLLGGCTVWWSQGAYRRAARELDRMKAKTTRAGVSPVGSMPALPASVNVH